MLQTNCPKCKSVIESPYLNELSSVKCGQCQEVVTVERVFVATRGFTIHPGDLTNRISRYEKLLREVEAERKILTNDKTVSEKTSQSFDQFCLTLHELLEGTKSHFRLKMTRELYLQMNSDHNKSKVKLIDISTGGASLECEMLDSLPRPKAMINLQMTLPKFHEPISAPAKVVWFRRLTEESDAEIYRIGVKFVNLDENARPSLSSFITQSSAGSSSFRAA